jgi:hypothetical protein
MIGDHEDRTGFRDLLQVLGRHPDADLQSLQHRIAEGPGIRLTARVLVQRVDTPDAQQRFQRRTDDRGQPRPLKLRYFRQSGLTGRGEKARLLRLDQIEW